MNTLRELGEDALVKRLLKHTPLGEGMAGPGDDCAVMPPPSASGLLQLLKTDAIVSGIHFTPDTDARRVGRKAISRVVSDFAAMGGQPEHFLITIAIDPNTPVEWLDSLYQGIGECLREHHAHLAGGETTSVPAGSATVISVAATGSVHRDHLVLRNGGSPGDALLVTGQLGGSLRGKHLDFTPRRNEAQWLVSHHRPSAMMDLSDGLAKDLPRLAEASNCGFRIFPKAIPTHTGYSTLQSLTDGEDYELLLAIDSNRLKTLLHDWNQAFPDLPLTHIGELCLPTDGDSLSGGWDHFAQNL